MTSTTKRTKKFSYDYIDIDIPQDCEENPEYRGQLAFLNAKERMKTYKLPAKWYVVKDDGNVVRVCRKSHKSAKKIK